MDISGLSVFHRKTDHYNYVISLTRNNLKELIIKTMTDGLRQNTLKCHISETERVRHIVTINDR